MVMGRAEGRDSAYHSNWVAGVDVTGSGFACPPVGTRFLLDIDNMDGRRVIQTVLGQRGIECRLHSNAWGTYGLIGGMIVNEAGKLTAQTVARLWPLQVGRSIATEEPLRSGKGMIRNIYTVSGVGWYQVGERRVLGYQIDMANDVEATGQRYILHFVWSPELRWTIRQRTEWVSGHYPEHNGADWDLLAAIPPAPADTATITHTGSGPGSRLR
jgi:hypothetical protein